ncbi:hypothetical protein GG851_15640 [Bordetella petrii]|nr:hypothetical protein [Bordetella petrii]
MNARQPATAPVRQRLAIVRQQAHAWWNTRTPRERTLLSVALAAIIAMLAWTLAIQPALRTIAQSHEQLPRLHADAARVDALIAEAQALQRTDSGRMDAAGLPDALRASLRRAGLEASAAVSEGDAAGDSSSRQWDIALVNADVARVMKWLAELPYLLHVQTRSVELARARIDGRDRPGSVTGRIRVSLPTERAQ